VEKKREKHFLFPMQEMGEKTQNGAPHTLVVYSRVGEIHMVAEMAVKKGKGSSSQITTQITPTSQPNHRDNKSALELSFDYSPPIQGSLQLLNYQRRKQKAGCSSLSPCSCNLAFKRRWEGTSCSGLSNFTSLF
jgi:hypothetical protein